MSQTAIVVHEAGDTSVLKLVKDHPMPTRKPGHVLVKNISTSVNPVDLAVRAGALPGLKYPKVPGGDVAGLVVEADESSKFKSGDKVFALTDGFWSGTQEGSYCEYVSVPEDWLARVPDNLPIDQAGGVPLVALTAWQAFEPAAQLAPGKRVLVQAAAGGVGHIAVQLAKAKGCYVVAVAGPANVHFVQQELGADEVVDYSKQDFAEVYKDQPFDVVFDVMGGEIEDKAYKLVKRDGCFCEIMNARMDRERSQQRGAAGERGEGPKYITVLVQPNGAQLQEVADLMAAGKVKLVVQESVGLPDVDRGHEMVGRMRGRGKVVVKVQEP